MIPAYQIDDMERARRVRIAEDRDLEHIPIHPYTPTSDAPVPTLEDERAPRRGGVVIIIHI